MKKAYVSLLAGQSNCVGAPLAVGLTGDNARYYSEYDGILYKMTTVNWQTGAEPYSQALGPLGLRTDTNFGVEYPIARSLAARMPRDRGPADKAVLLKYGAGGSPLEAWNPDENTNGHWTRVQAWLTAAVAEIEALGYTVVPVDMFWLQGEDDSIGDLAATYATRFNLLLAGIRAILPGIQPVFSELKSNRDPAADPHAKTINTAMRALYATSGDNNAMLTTDGIHYTADSLVNVGQRLAKAAKA